ncbi:hypothetical protein GQ457_13G004340 [Hibiscus cannabinus]
MSSSNNSAPEQLCYIPCNLCNIILAVNVPCSSLFETITVRCGQCSNLCSVNMAASFQSRAGKDIQVSSYTSSEYKIDLGSSSRCKNKQLPKRPTVLNTTTPKRVVNRPPEKRHRAPSLYNQFIKEEIQRIKLSNPAISALLLRIGLASLTFILDWCWRPITNLSSMMTQPSHSIINCLSE